jgi:hypothetical protein
MMPEGFATGSAEYTEYALQCWYEDRWPFGMQQPRREPDPVLFLSTDNEDLR